MGELNTEVLAGLTSVLGPERVLTGMSARIARTRSPAIFWTGGWEDHLPDAVVQPRTTEEVVAIVNLARRHNVPLVPRGGGTGLADGVLPRHHGIVVDTKLMAEVVEVDLENFTATVQPGINPLKLNENHLLRHGLWYPDDPASYAVVCVGGRAGTNGWSMLGGRYGHPSDLILSLEVVLSTGEVVRLGGGRGAKVRRSSTGLNLKPLLLGSQGTLGIITELTVDLAFRPEVEAALFFSYENFGDAYRSQDALVREGFASLAFVSAFDEKKVDFLRRDDEAFFLQGPEVQAGLGFAALGRRAEIEPTMEALWRVAEAGGGVYLGDEIADADWAGRHEPYAIPLHGRAPDGQVVPMAWHDEDAAVPWSEVPAVLERWHEVVDRYAQEYGIFDDWGCYAHGNGSYRLHGDAMAEIDIGVREDILDRDGWDAYLGLKKEIATVTIDAGGSISACHGATRYGDEDLVAYEVGLETFELMKRVKRTLDPSNIMNPGKYRFDEAFAEVR